jgi:hypothetical protein
MKRSSSTSPSGRRSIRPAPLIGLDSGADHPFGAVALVVTEKGSSLSTITSSGSARSARISADPHGAVPTAGSNTLWAANRNEAQLRLEFNAHRHLGRAGGERSDGRHSTRALVAVHEAAEDRVHRRRTFDQMKKLPVRGQQDADGQEAKEKVFKLKTNCRTASGTR